MSAVKTRTWARWASAFVILGVGAWFVWYQWLPDYRPELETGEAFGIDVSHHQGTIDWSMVDDTEVEFAYVKATEGGDWVDPRFESYWADATRTDIKLGTYHFYTLCTAGLDQALNYVGTTALTVGHLAPAVDLELAGNCSARPERDTMLADLVEFIKFVEAETGRSMMLYLGDDFEDYYDVAEELDREIWRLSPFRRPAGDEWAIWQVGGFFHIPGISGAVDLNVARPGALD